MMTSGSAISRITRELNEILKEPSPHYTVKPVDEKPFQWEAIIKGPVDSPFEGGSFKMAISFPNTYPFKPPTVRPLTKIYHPNINSGAICLDILQREWSPILRVSKVLLSLISLLCDPNPQHPLVAEIAGVYLRNRRQYDETAREWTRLYATEPARK